VLYLVPHNEGGDYPKRHADPDDPFRWDFANVPGLRERNCVAARVDEIGQMSYRKRN
jgi:CRISPR-associated endonuclease Csn1